MAKYYDKALELYKIAIELDSVKVIITYLQYISQLSATYKKQSSAVNDIHDLNPSSSQSKTLRNQKKEVPAEEKKTGRK